MLLKDKSIFVTGAGRGIGKEIVGAALQEGAFVVAHIGRSSVNLDEGAIFNSANVIDPDAMVAQTKRSMAYIANVLAEFDATLDDVVKVATFYQGQASAEVLHENLMIRSNSYTEPGPATTGIPVRNLVYPSMIIEIEVIAMIDSNFDGQ